MTKADFDLPEVLMLLLGLAAVALAALALRWLLLLVHVPRGFAGAISVVLGIITGLFLIAFWWALGHP